MCGCTSLCPLLFSLCMSVSLVCLAQLFVVVSPAASVLCVGGGTEGGG